MNDKNIHPDSVQLEENEKSLKFNRYWTRERLEKSKLLAKKIVETDFEVVESEGLRAEKKPEHVVVVKPSTEEEDNTIGLPTPKMPRVHIQVDRDCKVFKLLDNTHAPER
jgi:hypothetical protein